MDPFTPYFAVAIPPAKRLTLAETNVNGMPRGIRPNAQAFLNRSPTIAGACNTASGLSDYQSCVKLICSHQ